MQNLAFTYCNSLLLSNIYIYDWGGLQLLLDSWHDGGTAMATSGKATGAMGRALGGDGCGSGVLNG